VVANLSRNQTGNPNADLAWFSDGLVKTGQLHFKKGFVITG
jgi:hypothetical protein